MAPKTQEERERMRNIPYASVVGNLMCAMLLKIRLLKVTPIQIFNLISMIENQLLDLCSLLEREQ
ncbi:hypothetical protein CsSME_00002744 [Camellia sinensis var. sinensis]